VNTCPVLQVALQEPLGTCLLCWRRTAAATAAAVAAVDGELLILLLLILLVLLRCRCMKSELMLLILLVQLHLALHGGLMLLLDCMLLMPDLLLVHVGVVVDSMHDVVVSALALGATISLHDRSQRMCR
jgi:hypothetical protein